MNTFKNKYRIPSTRKPDWDYGWNAAYFVTICTHNRVCWFGDIENRGDVSARVALSPIGHIAHSCWHDIPNHFPFVKLGSHIIMPNHVHGIIIINKPNDGHNGGGNDGGNDGGIVETQNFASLPPPSQPLGAFRDKPKNQFGPQSQNLASIIRGFKIGVTKNARQINPDFAWQPRYHDHIIRNDLSFQRISAYIINNPQHWSEKTVHPKNPRSDNR